jgi:tricarballylate dehydrogenase
MIRDLGGEIFYNAAAQRLVQSADGSIAGLEVQTADGSLVTMQTRAVILACGGFEGNPEWLTRYIPNAYRLRTVSPGTDNNRGDGIRMATAIGADTAGQFDGAHVEPCDPRSSRHEPLVMTFRWGILVNREGQRFMDEASELIEIDFDNAGNRILRTQGNLAWAINDTAQQRTVPGFDFMNLTDQPAYVSDTIEGLAEQIGVDPQSLRRTVEGYNAATPGEPTRPELPLDGVATTGLTPPKSNFAGRLEEGPFMAWPVSGQICFTYGGLRVDGDTHVLDVEGRPIRGLYAAGEIAGIFYEQYPAGTSGLRSMTFGRRAGIVSQAETQTTGTAHSR